MQQGKSATCNTETETRNQKSEIRNQKSDREDTEIPSTELDFDFDFDFDIILYYIILYYYDLLILVSQSQSQFVRHRWPLQANTEIKHILITFAIHSEQKNDILINILGYSGGENRFNHQIG